MIFVDSRIVIAALVLIVFVPAARAQCTEGCVAIHDYTGEAPGDQYGWVSNHLNDLNGDGVREFIITAPTNDANGNNAGRVYVYDGASGSELFQATGFSANGWFGHDAGPVGDMNGDGVGDIIVGAPFVSSGRAYVLNGTNGALLRLFTGQTSGDQFGVRVAGGGDFNGDDVPDILFGAPNHDTAGVNAGRVYVYSGVTYTLITSIDGAVAGDRFGVGVSFIGDVNHDGRDDILIGAPDAGAGDIGEAYVYSWDGAAASLLYPLAPPAGPAQDFGQWFMNGDLDVNNDGTPDVYVNDFPANGAHVYSGINGSLLWTFSGDGDGQFGIGRIVDDVNGDGYADLLLAAWISPAGGMNAGKAWVYSGKDATTFETFTHDVPGAGFGFDANGMGDVNGDGREDYLITAASDLGGQGRAYVIAGNVTPTIPGDFDEDGDVDFMDLSTFLGLWGPCPNPCAADLVNGDFEVNFDDLAAFLGRWG